MIGAWRRLAWFTLVAACVGWLGAAYAQDADKAAAPAKKAAKAKAKAEGKNATKKDPAAAQSAYEGGVAAFEAGKLDTAVQQLSSAISNGGLPKTQMAKALYYRGISYRKQSKPAEAISDLTSALWLKGALVESDREDALQQRSAAYRDAGLPDQSQPESVRTKQAAPAQTASAPPRTDPAPEPAAPKSAAPSSGSFFSSWFGGSSSPSSNAAPVQTVPKAAAPVAAAAKPWGESTEISPAAAPAPAQKASPPKTQAKQAGRYSVQIAALRSRSEAQSLLARVQQQHAQDLGAREAVIDEAVVGNMGTLYRVRVGPFADANEPRALCARLKGDGLDCLLVTQ